MPQVPTEPLEGVLRRLEAVYSKAENANPGVGDATSSRSRPALDESILPILAAICLIPHNDPDDFAVLFRYFAASLSTSCFSHSQNLATLAHFVLRLRTSLFKAVPLVGVPRIINALGSLHDAVVAHPFGTDILATLPGHSTKPANTAEEDSKAGWEFFEAIYAQHAEKIIERIGTTSPDLAEMIVDDLYGRNLSRREVLSWKETVLIEFTGCAALDCPSQAKGHFYGCKNLGVDKREISRALEVLREIGHWRGEPFDESRMPFLKSLSKWHAPAAV